MLSRVWLSVNGCLGLRQCFAGLDALIPRVIRIGVTSGATVPEPRTAAAAATSFSRFRNDTAFSAYGPYGLRRGCYCVYMDIGQNTKMKIRKQPMHGMREDLSALRWP